jgi:hypothetical protein
LFYVSRKPPPFSIANGNAFGKAPQSLEALNMVEVSMVSRNRNTSHMFAFYAGQHQSIKGFHTLFKSNLPHTTETIRKMSDLGLPNAMSCVLAGPFTTSQKAQVMARTTICRTRLLAAFTFLQSNNVRYLDLPVNQTDYVFPDPLVIDSSEEEEGSDDPRENIFESNVFFPDGSEVDASTGGHSSSNRFTLEYFRRNLQGTATSVMTSRPTPIYASDLAKEFLVDSFPLQFPYGIGGPKDKRETKVEYLDMLQYYMRVADCNFMRHDFILLVHSLWEKEKAMKSAMIRCRVKLTNGESVAQQIGQLRVEDLENEMEIRVNGARREGRHGMSSAKMLLDGIDTSCKAMAHTNQASKSARRQMFSMWYSICSPGIFFTVSPCDETNFRLRLYIGRSEVSFQVCA